MVKDQMKNGELTIDYEYDGIEFIEDRDLECVSSGVKMGQLYVVRDN